MKSNIIAVLIVLVLGGLCTGGYWLLQDRQQAECAKRHASAVQVSDARYICVDGEGRIV
jgi:flagellar basal body-associated protein FliL